MATLEDQFFKKSVMDGDRDDDLRDEAKRPAHHEYVHRFEERCRASKSAFLSKSA